LRTSDEGGTMLRFITAGESHGKCLTGILEGLPSGLPVDLEYVNAQLQRRQKGYGRGGRQVIETDQIDVTSGIRHGRTLGSPISFVIQNKDWMHWQVPMSVEPVAAGLNLRSVTRPRPGHADLAGGLKHHTHDLRDILERASARETAARVAAGSFCRLLLGHFQIRIGSHVLSVGAEKVAGKYEQLPSADILDSSADSALNCLDLDALARMTALIDAAKKEGDTVGGVFEVIAAGVPPGLGSHTQWDRRLDGRLAQAMMAIPAVKAVEIGTGISAAAHRGSEVHDEIFYDEESHRFQRRTNRAGGVEGGISNGSDVRVRVYLKPIPTLRKPLASVDVLTKQPFEAAFERSDTCVVPAASVIGEAVLAIVLATAFMEKFGGDSIAETEANFAGFAKLLDSY
jgi:chorismate synthase